MPYANQAERRALGLCVKCNNEARPGRAKCVRCAEVDRENGIARRRMTHPEVLRTKQRDFLAKRKEEGLCAKCKNPARPGKTLCEAHAAKENARGLSRYRAMIAERVCPLCGEDLPDDCTTRLHPDCLAFVRAKRKLSR